MNSTPRLRRTQPVLTAVALLAWGNLAITPSALAASSNWNVNANGNWATAGSWLGSSIPGATTGTVSTDIATFGFTLTADRIVTVDTNRNIGGITFSGNNSAFKYTLSGGSLLLSGGGTILMDSTASGGTHTDSIASDIAIQGDGSSAFITNNGANTRVLSVGSIYAVSTAGRTTSLYLGGSNTGGNTVTGIISDGSNGGSLALIKDGASSWTLSGANNYSGKTIINAGSLRVSSLNSVNGGTPSLASSSLGAPTTVANGTIDLLNGSLTYIGTGETTDRVINLAGVSGSPSLDHSGSGLLKFTGNIISTGAASKTLILQGAGTAEISGAISDYNAANTTSINKNGGGTWTLSGANTYSGKTILSQGTLVVGSFNNVVGGTGSSSLGAPITVAAGTIDLGVNNNGGTLRYTGTGETTDRVLNLSGTTAAVILDQSGASGLLKFSSDLTSTGAGSKTLTLQGSTAAAGEIAGAIVNNSAVNTTALIKSGTGTWTLSGANTHSGGTTVTNGTLAIAGAGTLGAATNALTVSAGTLDLGTTGQTVGAITLTNTGSIINGSLAGTSVTATNTSGTATISASLLGSGALNQTGAGTLSLTGANTYTGATTISAGTLLVSGAAGTINNSSGYTLANGTLTLDNTAGAVDRLNDSAILTLGAAANLNLIQGTSSGDVTETVAQLAFDIGNSNVTVTSLAATATTLNITGGLTRSNNATGLVRGTSLGQQSTFVGKILLGNAPALGANYVGAGGSPTGTGTTKNLAIVPWLVGGTTTSSTGTAFVTYDTLTGLRPLVAGEVDTLTAGYTTTGNNVAQSGTITLTTVGHTFNSLFITGTSNLTGATGDSLTITSGALASTGTSTLSGFTNGITLGNDEGIITTTANTLTVKNSIDVTNSGGLTKAGAGTLQLTGAHTYTGATTVNQGIFRLGDGTTDASLATSGINTTVGGTTNFNNIGASTYSGTLSGAGAYTKTGAGVLTLDGSGAGSGTGAGIFTISLANSVKLGSATALQNTTALIGAANALNFATGIGTFTIGGLAGNQGLALADTGSTAITLEVGNHNANTAYSGVLSGTGGKLVKIGTGVLTLSGTNTFTGGLTIKEGAVQLGAAAAAGTGAITLGASSGNTDASLIIATASATIANNITLNTGGTLSLVTNGSNNITVSGGITGTNNLAINHNNTASGALTISGIIDNTGTITFNGTSTQNTVISGGIGANVTSVSQNSSSSLLTISGGIVVNSTGTTLANNGGRLFTISGAISGTGNLIIQNNSALASGTTLSGTINHTGAITNSGTGATTPAVIGTTTLSLDKNVLISGAIGSNVTTVTQDSATSVMELSAANTFSGNARVFSGSLILGHATAAGSSQILVGNTTGSADATLLLRQISIANNVVVQSGGSGIATLGAAASGGASTFTGTITLNKNAVLSPYNNNLTFTGLITGTGGLTVANVGSPVSSSGQTYGIGGGSVVLSKADLTNTFSGDVAITSGTLSLAGNATTNANLNGLLGTGTSAILIGDTSGGNSARFLINAGATGQTVSRNMIVQAGSGGVAGVGVSSSSGGSFTGNLTLNKSVYLLNGNSGVPTIQYSGEITLGSSAVGGTSVISSGGNLVKLINTANNYDGGSIASGVGTLWGSGAGSLGSGNAVAELGLIRLSDQVALAAGKTVFTGPLGGVSIGTNSTAQIAYIASVLDSSSSGGITLGTGISNTINLAAFGNGLMYLGTDVAGATYSATTLGTNSDGNYRLGFGRQTLTISSGALSDLAASVIVGAPGSTTGVGGSGFNTSGTVSLTGVNTYGGGTVVNTGSTLQGTQRTSAGQSPFGSATGAMTLHNATLRLQNSGTSSIGTAVGNFTFDGNSIIQLDGTTGGNNTLTVGTISRQNNGVLALTTVGGVYGGTVFLKTSGTTPATTSVLGGTAQMVAPYIIDGNNGNFIQWDSTNGFTPITTALDTTNFVGLGANPVTKITGNATLSADATVYALGLRPSAAATTILGSGGDRTLTITSGGIYQDGRVGSYSTTIGSNTSGQRVNLDFNNQEAVIHVYTSNNSALTIQNNIINATGLTKSGNSGLILAGTGSTFVGPITVLGTSGSGNSYLSITNDLNLGGVGAALTNGVVLDGGKLLFGGSMTLSSARTLTIGGNGAILSTVNSGNYGANTITLDSKITGNNGGQLTFISQTTGGISNTVSNTFALTNTANDFVAPIYVGNANQGTLVTLLFDTDSQLGHTANTVTLLGGNSVLRYAGAGAISSARSINFYDLGGVIDTSSAAGSWTNSGTLAGSGVFNKTGLGTLALTGSNTYTGNTIVSAGVLNVSHANALGATTAAITGSSGVSGGAAYVQSGAALEVQGNIALGNAGGKTLYLNGSGIGNTGALRNLSGANSNAGAVIFQSNTTIAVDSGSLALSGIVSGSGALTKIGSGTFTLSGANTYSGGTTVSVGTLIVNNSTGSGTGSGSVFIDSGATLAGSGTLAGAATVNGSLNPGNSPGVMTFNSGLTLGSSATTNIEIAGLTRGSQYDGIDVTGGSLTYGGTLTITFSSSSVSGTTYDLFNLSSGSPSGSFSSVSVAGSYVASLTNNAGTWTGSANGYDFTFTQSTGDLFVFAAIPEPASAAAIAALYAGLAAIGFNRRKRQA